VSHLITIARALEPVFAHALFGIIGHKIGFYWNYIFTINPGMVSSWRAEVWVVPASRTGRLGANTHATLLWRERARAVEPFSYRTL